MTSRRNFLAGAGASAVSLAAMSGASRAAACMPSLRADLDFAAMQQALVNLYDVDRAIVNFDAAYYGAMTKPVHQAYLEKTAWMNRYNSTFLRSAAPGAPRDEELGKSLDAIARTIGASREEVAMCAGGTDALYALIANYLPVGPGDKVIYADVDYDEMQFAMDYLAKVRGAEVVKFVLPEPHTRANILAAYEKVLADNPTAKLLLVTHVSNRNGLIAPAKEIVALAKARGVDVVLDSAQAVGQMPFDVADIGADFIGFSLHKWLAAPLGTGAIYIRKERQADIGPWFGNLVYPADDMRAKLPSGTADVAARLSVPAAVAVQDAIGIERKFDHLRKLRDYWVSRAADIDGIEMMLPDEPDNYGAISSFRLPGLKTSDQAKAVHTHFAQKHKLLIVAKSGLASGPVMRVTPSLFNTTEELDRLVAAIREERGMLL